MIDNDKLNFILSNYLNKLENSKDLYDIKNIVDEFERLDMPYIYQSAAIKSLLLNEYEGALPFFEKAINYGLNFPNNVWSTKQSDAIGSSIAKILTFYRTTQSGENFNNLYAIGYCYLSNSIEFFNSHGSIALESYEERAKLVLYTSEIIKAEVMPRLSLYQVYAISDYYFSAQGYKNVGDLSISNELMNSANEIHNWLEDISVGGKDADEYSLEEIVEIGKNRHFQLFDHLKKDLKKNKFSITANDLNKIISSLEPKY